MSDSTENTNELDSYGVWVKRPPQDANDSAENTLDESAFSLPDFDGSQIVDENAVTAENTFEPEAETPSFDIPVEDMDTSSSEDSGSDIMEEIDLDDFGDFSSDSSDGGESEVSLDDFLGDSGSSSGGSEEISLDDFLDGDSFDTGSKQEKEDDIANDEALDINLNFNESEENAVPTEEISEESEYEESEIEEEDETPQEEVKTNVSSDIGPMEEVSLDDFSLEDSDAATADAAAAAVAASASGSEDVSLEDFGIDSNAGETPVTDNVQKARKTVVDYDLAITEDDEITSAPSIKEIKTDPKAEDKETPTENTAVNNELLEQIIHDLSGLKNEISALKNDLAVLKDKSSFEKAPGFPGNEEITADVPETVEEEPSGFFSNSDEDETIALSGDEISNIMNSADFTEEIAGETIPDDTELSEPQSTPDFAEEAASIPEEADSIEPVAESEPMVTEPLADETAFDDMTDDLVTEEETSEPVLADIPEDSLEVTEEDKIEDLGLTEENDILSDSSFDIPDESINEPVLEEEGSVVAVEDTPIEETPVFDEALPTEDAISEEPFVEEPIAEASAEDSIFEEPAEDSLAAETVDDSLSVFDDVSETEDALSEDSLSEDALSDIPDEINIPKVDEIAEESDITDDILVESSSSDFMNSVTAEEDTLTDEPVLEEPTEPVLEDALEEPLETVSDDTLVEDSPFELPSEEPVAEEPAVVDEPLDELSDLSSEEPALAAEELPDLEGDAFDIQIEEPEPSEPEISEEAVIDDLMDSNDSVEENLTEANVDYLSEDIPVQDDISEDSFEEPAQEEVGAEPELEDEPVEEAIIDEQIVDAPAEEVPEAAPEAFVQEPAVAASPVATEASSDDGLPGDLKNDVKSVLLYMDQLLENLPEDKIMEFAKSEQFTTYKKLFAELGLS